jgi:Icc-related predicted phosphoesterase
VATTKKSTRLAALADVHCTRTARGTLQPLFATAAARADVMLLCGDLTDYGQPEEAHVLAQELATARIPVVAVLGNHDFESGKADEVSAIICEAGVNLLDGEVCEVHGVGFAGVKGFCGGFGAHQLSPWGEPAIKTFVHEAVDEALKLERALGRLETDQRIVLMHYSPIKPTVEGEPPETFPFLGSSRLEEPLTRYPVQAVFHGHAHHGRPEGKAMGNIPVFNVALPLMKKIHADGSAPFRIFEVPVPAAA